MDQLECVLIDYNSTCSNTTKYTRYESPPSFRLFALICSIQVIDLLKSAPLIDRLEGVPLNHPTNALSASW